MSEMQENHYWRDQHSPKEVRLIWHKINFKKQNCQEIVLIDLFLTSASEIEWMQLNSRWMYEEASTVFKKQVNQLIVSLLKKKKD